MRAIPNRLRWWLEDRTRVKEQQAAGSRERRCGRLGDHPAHEWKGRNEYGHRRTYHCTGHTTTEGGWRAHGKPLDQDRGR